MFLRKFSTGKTSKLPTITLPKDTQLEGGWEVILLVNIYSFTNLFEVFFFAKKSEIYFG